MKMRQIGHGLASVWATGACVDMKIEPNHPIPISYGTDDSYPISYGSTDSIPIQITSTYKTRTPTGHSSLPADISNMSLPFKPVIESVSEPYKPNSDSQSTHNSY
jgi:hypothetical protein